MAIQENVALLAGAIAPACEQIQAEQITTAEGAQIAGLRLRWVSDATKTLEREKAAALDPIAATVAKIKSWFAPLEGALAQADETIRARLTEYEQARRAHNLGALVTGVPMLPAAELSEVQMVATTEIEIVDAALVPRHLCAPDMKKIRAAAADGQDIPGVQVTRTTAPRLRARR